MRIKNYGSLIPAGTFPAYVPNGSVEVVLGALIGYLLGNTKKQPLVGALLGAGVGLAVGQIQPTVAPIVVAPAAGPVVSTMTVTDNTGRDWRLGVDAAGSVASIVASIAKMVK